MGKRAGSNIILIGFSTTGKSQVAKEVSKLLGWDFVDADDEIAKLAGKSIPQIFAQEGEEHFRKLERQALRQACEQKGGVIATGGGAVLDPQNQELMTNSGMVVCLEAKVETIYQRLLQDTEASGPLRPLLAVSDPLERIEHLKEFRQPYYAIADWTVHTDNLNLKEVAQEVVRGWHRWRQAHLNIAPEGELACEVVTATECYPIFAGWGLLKDLGKEVRQVGLFGTVYVISDEIVFSHYGNRAEKSLRDAGFKVNPFLVPAGEATKTLNTAIRIYDWVVEHHAERSDVIAALGGGMVGDLAGFVAATFMRGLPLVQVPTSLVAMVDAAIGGKTAVNHPQAKNLIGSFYQPRLVLADVQTLTTLPQRELISGWAEVIKHGLILDAELVEFLEDNAEELLELEPTVATEAIKRSARIKARIVSEDERESGRRTLLNYGHTIAHGLEAATNYEHFLHGEAVAIGMMGAALLSHKMGLLSWEIVERQRAILGRFGLPTYCSDIDLTAVLRAMKLDKKVREEAIRWVLLQGIAQPVIRDDVSIEQVMETVEEIACGG